MFRTLGRLFAATSSPAAARPARKPALGVDKLEVRDCPAYFGWGSVMLNPQPLPPREGVYGSFSHVMLNPQPLPPRFAIYAYWG